MNNGPHSDKKHNEDHNHPLQGADDDNDLTPPPGKKTRHNDSADSNDSEIDDLVDTAWIHWQNYLESCTQNVDAFGDEDELQELLEVVSSTLEDTTGRGTATPLNDWLSRTESGLDDNKKVSNGISLRLTRRKLLPVLASVAATSLADQAIAAFLHHQQQQQQQNEGTSENSSQIEDELHASIQSYLSLAVRYFPHNASSWSIAANYGRMTQRLSLACTTAWYIHSAQLAHNIRNHALEWLELPEAMESGDNEVSSSRTVELEAKEWIEVLLLHQVVGVELLGDDKEDEEQYVEEEENGDQEVEEERNDSQHMDDAEEKISSPDHDEWSSSRVEATARFMAVMLCSLQNRHDDARTQLVQHFPQVTHRLHPTVWEEIGTNDQANSLSPSTSTASGDHLALYRGSSPNAGVLPQNLYERLCHVFAPEASYWKESDYSNRGYYSYFMDHDANVKKSQASNLLHDVILNYMLPLVEQHSTKSRNTEAEEEIRGFEWWIHTRPIQANLGHNLHFDTDEALLAQEGNITHPRYSSVMYLTGGDGGGGATIVFDQIPDSQEVSRHCWKNQPEDNTLLIFPGNLLHGVLPCPGTGVATEKDTATPAAFDMSKLSGPSGSATSTNPHPPHRLTLLVGFWTRRVPDQMKERKLYGPCGPLPPKEDYAWVRQIYEGYEPNSTNATEISAPSENIVESPVPCITPAWECLHSSKAKTSTNSDEEDAPGLEIPRAIDHRFFVRDAPLCFRQSLFERDEDDDCDDDQVEEYEDEPED